MRALGRDVELDAIDLGYVNAERRIYATGQTRQERRSDDGIVEVVAALLRLGDGCTTTALKQETKADSNIVSGLILAGARRGYLERHLPDGSVHEEAERAPKGVRLSCAVTAAGIAFHNLRMADRDG